MASIMDTDIVSENEGNETRGLVPLVPTKVNSGTARLQYSRQELIEISKTPFAGIRPEVLNAERYKKNGILRDPNMSYVKHSVDENKAPQGKVEPRKAEPGDGLILSPPSLSWGKGCGSRMAPAATGLSTLNTSATNLPVVSNMNIVEPRPPRFEPRPRPVGSGRLSVDDGRWKHYEAPRDQAPRRERDVERQQPRFGRDENRWSNVTQKNPRHVQNSSYDRPNHRAPMKSYGQGYNEKEPEWMSDGPTSQLECIELGGFDDDVNTEPARGRSKEESLPSQSVPNKQRNDIEPNNEGKEEDSEYLMMDKMLSESILQLTTEEDDDSPDVQPADTPGKSRFAEWFSPEPRGARQAQEVNRRENGPTNEGNDLMQLLQKARINMSSLKTPPHAPMNVANMRSLAELEGAMRNMDNGRAQQDGHRQSDEMALHQAQMEISQRRHEAAALPVQHLVGYRGMSPTGPVNFQAMFANPQMQPNRDDEIARLRRQTQEIERRREEQQRQFQSPSIANPFTPTSVIRKIAATRDLPPNDMLDRNSSQDPNGSFAIRAITKTQPGPQPIANFSSDFDRNRMLHSQRQINSSPLPMNRPPLQVQANRINSPQGFRHNGSVVSPMHPQNLIQAPVNQLALMQHLQMMQQRSGSGDPRQMAQQAHEINAMQQLLLNAVSLQNQVSGNQTRPAMTRPPQQLLGHMPIPRSDMNRPGFSSPGTNPQHQASERNQPPPLQRLFARNNEHFHNPALGMNLPPVPLQQAVHLEDLERD